MTESTDGAVVADDLTEENPQDSELIKKLRAQLKEAKAQAKAYESEVVSFRETQKQARVQAVEAAVNGRNYPQAVVDALVSKVQDADEDEVQSILSELGQEAPAEAQDTPPVEEEPQAPSPSSLGQQVAAAASGGSQVDGLARLQAAKSEAELQAVAAELGLNF